MAFRTDFLRLRWALAVAIAIGAPIDFATTLHAGDRAAAEQALARGEQFQAKRDLRSARIEYLNAIKADPDWAEVRLRQARIYLGLYNGVAAEAELQRALDLGVSQGIVRAAMGHALELQGNYAAARKWLSGGAFATDDLAYGLRILGRVQIALGDMDAAREAFNRALTADEGDSMLWVDIAHFRMAGGEQGAAVAAVDRAVELDGANVRALQLRGELLRGQYGLASAIPWFERALELSPNDVPVMVDYAATLGDMGRMSEMLAMTRRILNVEPGNPNAFFLQAVLAARAGKFELAQSLMLRTGSKLDGMPAAMMVDGIVEYQLGNYNASIQSFERLFSIQPENRRVQHLLARALYRNGEFEDVVQRFSRLADLSDASPYMLTLIGRAHEELGHRKIAARYLDRAAEPRFAQVKLLPPGEDMAALDRAIARDPNNALVVIPYVRALLARGEAQAALPIAARLETNNPDTPDAIVLLGDVLRAADDLDGAMDYYRRAAAIRFDEPVMVRMYDIMRGAGDSRRAGQLVTDYLNANPGSLTALRMLASAHLDVENWREADRLLSEVRARYGNNDPLLLADHAMAKIKLGQEEEAAELGRLAYAIQPSSNVATQIYGLALLEANQSRRNALDLLQKAAFREPENGYYAYNLARAYLANGDRKRALVTLQRALLGGDFYERKNAQTLYARLRDKIN